MIQIDKQLIQQLLDQALINPRRRQCYDLRNNEDDNSQRLLYALMPGTKVDIHRHINSNETFVCLCGNLVSVIYEEDSIATDILGMDAQDVPKGNCLRESARYMLNPSIGNFGCVVPAGAWHTVEVFEPSVVLETKDGKYGEDGSETLDEYKDNTAKDPSQIPFSNCLGDLKKNIEYLIGMERQAGNVDAISPQYVARMLNVPMEEVERVMKEME